jgi:hypothetical protein
MVYLLWLLTASFGLARLFVPTRTSLSPALSYEALAHVFVGGLLGAAFTCCYYQKQSGKQLLLMAVLISAIELAMFLYHKLGN